jgi:hypothetical protein
MTNKIYWYGFTRQLKELFYLLRHEKLISCEWDEFFTHFTGKKFTLTQKPKTKLTWNGEKYLLAVITAHLIEKRFLDSDNLKEHFENIKDSKNEFEKNKNKPSSKKLQKKLDYLFPATSGYRCKERLFYRGRNKQLKISAVVGGVVSRQFIYNFF